MADILWTARDIAAVTNGTLRGDDFNVTGISTDTRSVGRGDLFIALTGPKFDGNQFAAAAIEKGAAGALTSAELSSNAIIVPDTLQALRDLGAGARARSHAKIFAVTGSVGKTSTKAMLATALSALGDTHAAEASLNNHWGVPLSLARMPVDSNFAVFEIGMNHAGEIAPLSTLVSPHVSIITTVASAHIQHLGSMDNIARAKAEIFQGMDANGVAVLPRDSEYYPILLAEARTKGIGKIVTFGTHDESDLRLVSADVGADKTVINATRDQSAFEFTLGVPGIHQALNALAVLAAVHGAGLNVNAAAAALADLNPVAGRGNRLQTSNNITLIDETHNASPIAVEAALALLGSMKVKGRRVVVLGDMLELGDDAPLFHAALHKPILDARADLVLTAGPMMHYLADALPESLVTHYPDSAALAAAIGAQLKPGDTVLVKGSRGSQMKRVIDALGPLGQIGDQGAAAKTG